MTIAAQFNGCLWTAPRSGPAARALRENGIDRENSGDRDEEQPAHHVISLVRLRVSSSKWPFAR